MPESLIAADLLAWFDRHGRHDLPWQQNPTPYRVWLSEIMLQQTRVDKVIPYFQRCVARFPTVADLAAAELDEVLALWAGLGYYARARHLHQAARQVAAEHRGVFPETFDRVLALPGIGRSTAGAILSLGGGQAFPILDGNVKRVFARLFAVAGWPGRSAVQRVLWRHAEEQLSRRRPGDYNQALMDLGASLCSARNPQCETCPLRAHCRAQRDGEPAAYPTPAPRAKLPVKAAQVLLIMDHRGHVLLERRPPAGIWGGLWSLPEAPEDASPVSWCVESLGLSAQLEGTWPRFRHTFSHYHFEMQPVLLRLTEQGGRLGDTGGRVWQDPHAATRRGLPAPVARLLNELKKIEPRRFLK